MICLCHSRLDKFLLGQRSRLAIIAGISLIHFFSQCSRKKQAYFVAFVICKHTSAKLIEIQQNCLSKIHILHDLGRHMESNDTLHGSELVPHWVLGPKNWKFGPMGPKIFAQKFLYTKLVRYHDAILWGFEAKIVFGAKRVSNIQIPDFSLSVGQKNQIDFVSSKSSLC